MKPWVFEELSIYVHCVILQDSNLIVQKKACFTVQQDIPGVYQVYTVYVPEEGHLCVLASFVAQARLAAFDLDFLRIFSVLATESQPTRCWGHNQVLIS